MTAEPKAGFPCILETPPICIKRALMRIFWEGRKATLNPTWSWQFRTILTNMSFPTGFWHALETATTREIFVWTFFKKRIPLRESRMTDLHHAMCGMLWQNWDLAASFCFMCAAKMFSTFFWRDATTTERHCTRENEDWYNLEFFTALYDLLLSSKHGGETRKYLLGVVLSSPLNVQGL